MAANSLRLLGRLGSSGNVELVSECGRRAQQGRNYVQILPVSESVEGIWQEPACFSADLTISGNIAQGRTGFQHHTLAAAVRRSRQEPPN